MPEIIIPQTRKQHKITYITYKISEQSSRNKTQRSKSDQQKRLSKENKMKKKIERDSESEQKCAPLQNEQLSDLQAARERDREIKRGEEVLVRERLHIGANIYRGIKNVQGTRSGSSYQLPPNHDIAETTTLLRTLFLPHAFPN